MSKKHSKFADFCVGLVVKIIIRFLCSLPHNVCFKLSNIFGLLSYLVLRKRRKIAVRNLSNTIYDESEYKVIKETVKQIFINIALTSIEFARFPVLLKDIDKMGIIYNVDILKSALKNGNGALMVVPHSANWELAGAQLNASGIPVSVVARPLDFPSVDKIVNNHREKAGLYIIPKKNALRNIMTALKQGRVVCLLIDQNSKDASLFVPFLGKSAATVASIASLSFKTEAPIFIGFPYRENKRQFAIISGPIKPTWTGNRKLDNLRITAILTHILEGFIRRYPEQWLWLHQRWKTRPRPQDFGYFDDTGRVLNL